MDCVLRDMIIQASCRRWRKAVTTRVEAEAVVDVLLRFRVEPWLNLEGVLVRNLVVPAVERLGVVPRRREGYHVPRRREGYHERRQQR